MKKYGYCLICSVVLLAVLAVCVMHTEITPEKTYPIGFSITQGDYETVISVYESEDGGYYAFLPSYADMAKVKIVPCVDSAMSLGGISVTNGMSCEAFALETPYALVVDDNFVAELQFYKSANVATLFVDTITGDIERIHKNKSYSEQASVRLYTVEGTQDVTDSTAYIKGRGNATWYYGKRPYILTMSSEKDVLGMGAATKWILLANAADPTNLNNKLVLDLASQTGQGWSPECEFVDVYLNGEYYGLYLLTEKVEVGPSRLDIDTESGDFLCKVDLEHRWRSLTNPIKTQRGRTVEISSPDPLSDTSKTSIVQQIDQMEQIIVSGSDLTKVENFDLDSWIQKYLLDEISGNMDADYVSSYFYLLDGVFYGGPLWDYDMSFGNSPRNIYPISFLAKNIYKLDGYSFAYYPALYANESFYNRMVEIYQSEFLPKLNQLIDGGLSDLAAQIQPAATMNHLRWQSMFDTIRSWNAYTVFTVEDLLFYLENRVAFLNAVWIEGAEYCTVQFEPSIGATYMSFSVRKGEALVTDYIDLKNTVWYDKSTGSTVDFSQPIHSDMIVSVQQPRNVQNKPADSGTLQSQEKDNGIESIKSFVKSIEQGITNGIETFKIYMKDVDNLKVGVSVLSIVILAVFFICMVSVDFARRRKERRGAHESNKSHVSP